MEIHLREYDGVHIAYREHYPAVNGMPVSETFPSREVAEQDHTPRHGPVIMHTWPVYLHIEGDGCPERKGEVRCVADCPSEESAELVAGLLRKQLLRVRGEGPAMKFVAAVPSRAGGGGWGIGDTIMEAVETAGYHARDPDSGNPRLFYCSEDAEVQPLPTGIQVLGSEVFNLGELRLKKRRESPVRHSATLNQERKSKCRPNY